ncbi:MAG: family 20 glycosylhydrolase [Kiritimatiellae bacterium]|nr:family 20 glycosylhydrolase [Kiritimatiellia bacterium]
MKSPVLLPVPRRISWTGEFRPKPSRWTVVAPEEWRLAIEAAIQGLDESGVSPSKDWMAPDPRSAAIEIRREPAADPSPEAYRLEIAHPRIRIAASHPVGAARALATLRQLCRASEAIPVGVADDAPAFTTRGVMLDISRDRVPTMATLRTLVDLFAELKFNRLELYTEHTFAYARHPEVWAHASPMTPDEIRALDDLCASRFIELVPNQNSFGHMERWLRLARYRDLAEAPDGWIAPWGPEVRSPTTLYPGDPRALELVGSLYDELLPCFRSDSVNVGGDETWELGQGRSRARCEREGKGRVYLDYLLGLHRLCVARGRTMHFWGDMILHYPELIPEIPRDVIALDWGYEAEHPFDDECAKFSASGLSFFVCPGTSSWNSIAGRGENARVNLRGAAAAGLRHGAAGYLVTDWGDNGHWQPLPVSFLPWAAAAEHAWSGSEARRDDAIHDAAARHVFRDADGRVARAAEMLSEVYRLATPQTHNNSEFFRLLAPEPPAKAWAAVSGDVAERASEEIRAAVDLLECAPAPATDDGAEVVADLQFAARGLQLACRRARTRAGRESGEGLADAARQWADEHLRRWHIRSRPGGAEDSAARIEQLALALKQ